jgi:hypothetical protein
MKKTGLLKTAVRLVPVVALAVFGVMVSAVGAGATPPPATPTFGQPYNCTGGNVPPGTYSSVIITGICYAPAGTITVRGDLTVAPGDLLDAVTPGDPVGNPLLPATVVVGGNVNVGKGAVLVLGCTPSQGCNAINLDRIGGSLTGIGAQAVVLHGVSIGGNVSLFGGGGGAAGGAASGACFASPIPAPWSDDPALSTGANGSPQFTDFEENSIGGNLSILGMQTCWLGSFRNQIRGSVSLIGDQTSDPDGMEIGSNLAGGNMTCLSNLPAVQFGDSGGAPNTIGGFGFGQCGLNVVLPNPAPEANAGPGVPEPITVSAWRLGTYFGAHTQQGASIPIPLGTPNVTESGNTLVAEFNNVVLSGRGGLTGSITVVPGGQPGMNGETVVASVGPDGSESFEAFDDCACTFQGQSGPVSITAYGTVSANGVARGTFLITSGGGTVGGGLDTLAGFGSFSSLGQPAGSLGLVEHLAITGAGSPHGGHVPSPWFRGVLNR